MSTDSPTALSERIETVVGETVGEATAWTLDATPTETAAATADDYRITLPDRTVDVEQHNGPADAVYWVLTLRADGAIVSKFGPHESAADLLTELRGVLESDVGYTVCCDGDPDN